jgi:prepilin peptidase CpaA
MVMLTDAVRLLVFPALMAFAASSDLFTMTISNRVTLALVGGFVAMAFISGMSPSDVLAHAGAAATVLAVTFLFFARGWIGGGDAKLAAATALWFGFDHLVVYLLYASVFGGALTLAMIRFRMMTLPQVFADQEWVKRLHRPDGGVPYGIALAGRSAADLSLHHLDAARLSSGFPPGRRRAQHAVHKARMYRALNAFFQSRDF